MSEKKINWLLILQGWAMLWVVIGHAFIGDINNQVVWPGWERSLMGIAYSFHMPLFMLVSGWLFYMTRLKNCERILNWRGQIIVNDAERKVNKKRWSYKNIIKDKALRILLPGLVFSILALCIKQAVPGEVARQAGLSIVEIVKTYLYPFNNPFRELWFIAALFWLFALTPVWQFVLKRQWTMWTTVAVLLVLHFYHPETMFLSIDRVGVHALWFFLGLVISKEDVVDKFFKQYKWLTLIAGIAIYAIGYIYVIAFFKTIGGIVFSFGLALIADKYIPCLFFTFRNYTYQIFLMGIFAQMFVKIMFKHISMPYIGAYILCILLGLYVPVFVSKLIEKVNWKSLSLCVGLKAC